MVTILLTGCQTAKEPIAQVASKHRHQINSESESEQIWRLAGYGEYSELKEDQNQRQQRLLESQLQPTPSAAEVQALKRLRERERLISIEQWVRSELPSTIVVYFNPGESVPTFTNEQEKHLEALVARAKYVDIRGRTDSLGEDSDNDRLALDRALAAKRYLLNLGVQERSISLNYAAENNFVGDEASRDARAKNRRVEIEFVLEPVTQSIYSKVNT